MNDKRMASMLPKEKDAQDRFVEYYAEQSATPETRNRFTATMNAVKRASERFGDGRVVKEKCNVIDIGCGAGTQTILWAAAGHRSHGVDINEGLLDIARKRSADSMLELDFRKGSAAKIPFADSSMDVCLAPEVLEHVEEWEKCLDEFSRILSPHGIIFISTSNRLCPYQNEFRLPLYSWYPKSIKRFFVRLAKSSKPQLANFAKYPAVNWFTFYELRGQLATRGFQCYDRFDVMDIQSFSSAKRTLGQLIRSIRLCRLIAHIGSPSTIVFAIKKAAC
jgi:2-polyprenyl-6-hydroxyphenyl methylase/3-demethylubiquinone-9 3-methyltransferase